MLENKMRFQFRLIAVLIVSLASAATSFGFQSGSRSAAPSPSFSGQSIAQPIQGFTSPQTILPQAASGSGSRSIPSFPQDGFSQQGLSQQSFTNQQPAGQAPQSAGGSPGIPNASVIDPIFQIHDPYSNQVLDHSSWDYFLSRYLSTDRQGLNRICYGAVTGDDRNVLQGYLQQLQSTDIRTLNRSEQMAYWFNLYNARTVSVVLDNYPIRSIRQVKEKFTDFVGPFDDANAVQVLGKSLSLNDIESGIVRPVFQDPRIHYALNCASYGCPNLAATAWTGHDIDSRLDAAAYEYINSNRGVKRGLFGPRLAKIYKWYAADFGESDQAVLSHIQRYSNEQTCSLIGGRQKIGGYFYDWSLNDARVQHSRILESVRR